MSHWNNNKNVNSNNVSNNNGYNPNPKPSGFVVIEERIESAPEEASALTESFKDLSGGKKVAVAAGAVALIVGAGYGIYRFFKGRKAKKAVPINIKEIIVERAAPDEVVGSKDKE